MNYRRNFVPGGSYFFTVVAFRRRPLFRGAAAVHLLRDVMRRVAAKRPFRTDHLHAV